MSAVARGFAVNGEKPHGVLKTVSAKLALARNLKRLHETLEPVETIMNETREKLLAEEQSENPQAREFSPARVEKFTKAVKELNEQVAEIKLDQINLEDLDLDRIEGEEGLLALAVLDEIVLRESPTGMAARAEEVQVLR